jgi:hypothetical protein
VRRNVQRVRTECFAQRRDNADHAIFDSRAFEALRDGEHREVPVVSIDRHQRGCREPAVRCIEDEEMTTAGLATEPDVPATRRLCA